MANPITIDDITNLDLILKAQKSKLDHIREKVKALKFHSIDLAGNYSAVSYRAIDGGMTNISLDPIEADIIEIADSYGNVKMKFCISSLEDQNDRNQNFSNLNSIPEIQKLLQSLNVGSIENLSEILNNSGTYMEIAEYACMFDKITDSKDERVIIMRDGLLRSKKFKSEYIKELIKIAEKHKDNVKLVGVSKTSKLLSMLSYALYLENIFPSDGIGYVKIPLELEVEAYTWSGSGMLRADDVKRLNYAFGDLYIAKLSKKSNLLVTVEIPSDTTNDPRVSRPIYNQTETDKLFGHLAKDSEYSYPIIGYPQTIMLAHETAVRLGFPSDLVKDLIKEKMMNNLDEKTKILLRDYEILKTMVDKGVLGGDA